MRILLWFRRRGFIFWFMWIAGLISLVSLVVIFTVIAEDQGVISFAALRAKPDLSLSMSSEPQVAERNGPMIVTIRVSNDGEGMARRIVLATTLPNGVRFVAAEPPDPACYESESIVHCRLDALRGSQDTEVVISVAVEDSAPTDLVFASVVENSIDDPNPANNTASVSTRVE